MRSEASVQSPAFPALPRQSGLGRLAGSIEFLRSHTDTSLTRDFVIGLALHVCGQQFKAHQCAFIR